MSELIKMHEDYERNLIDTLSKDVWGSLEANSQTGILTSEVCLNMLKAALDQYGDYSASIMPLMKVAEDELQKNFYLPYLDYLRKNYEVQEYIRLNDLANKDITPYEARRKILFHDRRKGIRYNSGKNRKGIVDFTLGNFQFSVGASEFSKNKCDITAVYFYKEKYFSSSENEDIVTWICNFVGELESVVRIRNDSAHAGLIQSINDANTALDIMIRVDKLILKIIKPSL